MMKLELRLRRYDLVTARKQLSKKFYQIAEGLLRSTEVKVGEIRELHGAIVNELDRKHFPHIVGLCCIKPESQLMNKLSAKILSSFPCIDIYRAKVRELRDDRRGRFLALKRFYLESSFVSYQEFHDYQHNYFVFVNDALYYHDFDAVIHQNRIAFQLVSRGDISFLINESAFLCQKLKIYVPGYQHSAYMRSLEDYVNDIHRSTVEGEIIHLDTWNNMRVKTNQGQFILPYYEHNYQPSYLQLLLLGRRMRFVKVDQHTISMRRYRNIHCMMLNTKIQKGIPMEGIIVSKEQSNLVLDLGYGIRAVLPVDKRYQDVLFKQFLVGDTILVKGAQPMDAFYMNRVEGYPFFSHHLEARMAVGLIVKFARKGYKSFIIVALSVNEFVSVECESTSHLYYGPGHYVILKRDEAGNYSLYKSLLKQYISFSYGPTANTETVLSGRYQHYISFVYSETVRAGELVDVQPAYVYSLVPGNLFYCAVKSLGSVPSIILPDFTGQPVNMGIDFCKKNDLANPRVEYMPTEELDSDENCILEMHPEPGTAIQPGHQILFTVPKMEVSPFQIFQDEQVSISSSTLSISRYLNVNQVFDEEWKLLVLEFFVNHLCATRFQLLYYLRLYKFDKDKLLDKLISRCLALNILIQCDIQNEHRRSVRVYTLNPYVAEKCRNKVDNRIISYNVVYRLWDSVTIKTALSNNQAYLYLLTQYQDTPRVLYYSEFVQYIKPATAERGFVKVHLCCVLPDLTLLLFEPIRDFTKTRYLNKSRLSYPEEYINKILRLDAFIAERIPLRAYKAVLYLLCETPSHLEWLQNELSHDPCIQGLRHVWLRYISDIDTNLNKFDLQTSPFPQINTDEEEPANET